MFKHLLVPLDGSKLAESALPEAAYLARVLKAKATLCHIIERDAPAMVNGEPHLKEAQEAEAYLEGISRRSFPSEVAVERHVHSAVSHDVAEGIVAHQDQLVPDLIVMCTHGRHSLRRMIIGSIAEKVIASGGTPVLLVHAEPTAAERSFECHTVLAPVDGGPEHERETRLGSVLDAQCRGKGSVENDAAASPSPGRKGGGGSVLNSREFLTRCFSGAPRMRTPPAAQPSGVARQYSSNVHPGFARQLTPVDAVTQSH